MTVEIRPLGPDSNAFLIRESFGSVEAARLRAAAALRDWAAEDLERVAGPADLRDPANSRPLAAIHHLIAERLELAADIAEADGPLEARTAAGELVRLIPHP